MRYDIITENSTLIATGLSGDLDTMFIPEPQFNPQVEEHPDWRIVEMQGAFVSEILVFNSKKAPLENMNLRLAIMHAVHPEAVNQAVHNNLMIQALGGQWPNGTLAYSEVPGNPQVAYPDINARRERAKELLAQSGVDVEAINAEAASSSRPTSTRSRSTLARSTSSRSRKCWASMWRSSRWSWCSSFPPSSRTASIT